jgi:hypothetical protein
MRSRTFDVPVDVIGDFAEIVDDNTLPADIEGVADNGDIIVNVEYEAEQKKVIDQIHELIDHYNDNREEEEEEEEEEDDD